MDYSVALCTYNGEKFLHLQLDSIINQTYKPAEIIVCDDGSTDATLDILNSYQEKYPGLFKIFVNEINLRSVKNFEKAISLCNKGVIFLSDQDDIWVENKAERMLSFFEANPHIDALATNGYCIDENGVVHHNKYALWDVPTLLQELGKSVDLHQIITCVANIATGASMAFRASIRSKIIPIPILKNYHHDEWIVTVTSENGGFELLNEKLFYYRIHSNQQVGRVFFDKTLKNKNMLVRMFNINPENNFSDYKKLLKRLSLSYKKNLLLKKENNNIILYKISDMIKKKFSELKEKCIKHYPIRSKFLFFLDKITKKRQLDIIIFLYLCPQFIYTFSL